MPLEVGYDGGGERKKKKMVGKRLEGKWVGGKERKKKMGGEVWVPGPSKMGVGKGKK